MLLVMELEAPAGLTHIGLLTCCKLVTKYLFYCGGYGGGGCC